jgi:hypothetical protein
MGEPRYTVRPLDDLSEPMAIGLTLEEAFARIMALCERQYVFSRTGRVMRLYMSDANLGEPEFESDLPTDMYARRAIKAQVCEHGLGRYRVEATIPDIPKESRAA